jgi:predicted RNase H-like HicB family nuclease
MIIEWEPQGQVFVVTVPELPGCRTHGDTYEEAVQQGQYAVEGWIDASRHWGHSIPQPRYYDLGEAEVNLPEPVGASSV